VKSRRTDQNSGDFCGSTVLRRAGIYAGGNENSDGQCHRKETAAVRMVAARVKRCGKSAPRGAQATRHGKPHRVQGQIGNPGAARSRFRESETDSGYRLLRQMILSVSCEAKTEFGLQSFQNLFASTEIQRSEFLCQFKPAPLSPLIMDGSSMVFGSAAG